MLSGKRHLVPMGSWFDRLQRGVRKAQDAVRTTLEREQAAWVIGKTAGKTVTDQDGIVIVEAGRTIEPSAVERAMACGMLASLVSSVASAGIQDLQERISEVRAATPEGAEESALDSVEDYARARTCVGCIAGIAVTDIRGNVIVRSGARITEEDVRRARVAGLLNALIYSASTPLSATPADDVSDSPASSSAERADDVPPPPRRRLPLVDPESDRRT